MNRRYLVLSPRFLDGADEHNTSVLADTQVLPDLGSGVDLKVSWQSGGRETPVIRGPAYNLGLGHLRPPIGSTGI